MGLALVIVFVCSESVIIYYMMRSLKRGYPAQLYQVQLYRVLFQLYHPSATGGQPAQIYYMKKDKVEIPVSTLVLMIVTITYKFVLVLVGLLLIFFTGLWCTGICRIQDSGFTWGSL